MIELIKYPDDIKDVVLELTTKYRIDYLFLREQLNDEESLNRRYEIIIVLSNKESSTFKEINAMIGADMDRYDAYVYLSFVSASVREQLEQGSIFLLNLCHPSRLIFKNPSCTFNLYPEVFSTKKGRLELQRFLDRQNFKINEFKEGYHFYMEKTNFPLAAFMIHQVFEFLYRSMEIVILGKERKSHNIRGHHRLVGKISSVLSNVFNEKDENDDRLLSLLNKSYCGVRYKDDFEIAEHDLYTLQGKMTSLVGIADKLFQECLAISYDDFTSSNEIIYDNETQSVGLQVQEFPNYPFLTEILQKIVQSSDIMEIYLVSFRDRQTGHEGLEGIAAKQQHVDYVLLLISEVDMREEVVLLQNSLNGSLEYAVQLLGHSKLEVSIALKKGKRFFTLLLRGNKPIYVENDGVKWGLMTEQSEAEKHVKINKLTHNWNERKDRAETLIDGADLSDAVENNTNKIVMYSLALEQIFLGLLECIYDYRPNAFTLRHVFNICAGIWEFPGDMFPNNTTEEKMRLKMLTGILYDIRVKTELYVDCSEINIISVRCSDCVEASKKLVDAHFQKLRLELQHKPV